MADVKWIKITTDIFDDEKILLSEVSYRFVRLHIILLLYGFMRF